MCCPNCGKRIRKDQTVCPWCGASQDAEKTDGKKTTKKSGEKAPAQVHLSAKGATKRKKLTEKQKKMFLIIGISAGAVLLALIVTAVTLISSWLGKIQRESELSEGDIGINSNLPDSKEVQNIALFGLDSRADDDSGRSDAMIILSIDRVHNKVKLTSIARDSLVAIDGHGKSKITHAWSWGKAKLAVKTINQNFGMNITDYAYVNFYEFAKLVDLVGGVMIDVSPAELDIMNNYYGPDLRHLGYVNATAGYVRLNGAQALAYSRNRYTGSDIDRGNRQKEVLEAMFAEVKDMPLTKFPTLISQSLEMVHTTLSNSELMSIARWALASSPTFEQFSLPSKECKAQGGNWGDGHGWVWHYDMDLATQVLHNFIYEEGAQNLGSTTKSRVSTRPTSTTTSGRTTANTRATTTTTKVTKATTKTTVTTTTTTKTTATTTASTSGSSTTSTSADPSQSQDADATTSAQPEETTNASSSQTTDAQTTPTDDEPSIDADELM